MLTKTEIKAAIHDLQTFDRTGLTKGQLSVVNSTLGLFYEAYAQAVLDEHGFGIDVSSICGFIRYVNVIPLSVSMSARSIAPQAPGRAAPIAA